MIDAFDEIPRYLLENLEAYRRHQTAQNEYDYLMTMEKIRELSPRLYWAIIGDEQYKHLKRTTQ